MNVPRLSDRSRCRSLSPAAYNETGERWNALKRDINDTLAWLVLLDVIGSRRRCGN